MHIFISYAKADTRSLALQLRDAFSTLPTITAWMDTSLYSGEDWATQIQDEIDRSDLVVVLLSQDVNRPADHANGRSFVLKEIHYAQQVKKTIIPIMARPTRVPVQLAGIEYIDFTRDSTAALQRLINEVANRAGISVAEPVESTQLILYRRPIVIAGLVVFMIIALTLAVISSLNNSPKITPTGIGVGIVPSNTSLGVILSVSDTPTNTLPQITLTDVSIVPSNTSAAVIVSASDTPIITLPSVPSASSTSTLVPTAALTSISNITPNPLGFPGNLVTHNTDWIPQYQTFNGYEMALVPAGCFMMGSNDGQDDEKPVNQQCFDQPFWIDRYEVTNKQYGSEGNFKGANRPRDSVTWFESRDFCVQRGAHLPTEREWEYAARGPSNYVYPWGNDFVADNVVYSGNANNQTADVGSRPAGNSWVGASDFSGNVWEWVSTIYGINNNNNYIFSDSGEKLFPYPYIESDGREIDSGDETFIRILRGSSWRGDVANLRSAFRNIFSPVGRYNGNGFRCVHPY